MWNALLPWHPELTDGQARGPTRVFLRHGVRHVSMQAAADSSGAALLALFQAACAPQAVHYGVGCVA